ncbi:bifunctional proline dehydrogenase/L-glutamate gamma-semialdehyde dehydrogenase [Helcobacillus massiliensis]|uniref:bifunctional proline dehydrogenase/L-glutamate gamma-semialdehyde dehydrogenase n=1 Tax=Helcobacillus massiliensis TaxID=521392 RepID=UPI0025535B32|nr:bifunctional proline dehydrogenase/L-glutamate gamma-semialdehyde dehydrogenase [Helcobacillus massiliensis]MDK7741256.1 bifunctional proline dehydrogenase/L-glutamate gamma-semialdehyde dehydrogenase [Helcobacillus massiliensis]WOO94130.1 bifunctional proline dehydrogenase/L-glutamate gamma-semialdehyde dehydrogenase [Helcobacillus massiliensis]
MPRSGRRADQPAAMAGAVTEQVRTWVQDAARLPVPSQAKMLADVLADPKGLEFTVGFVDLVIRTEDPRAAAHHLRHLAQDPPKFLTGPLRSIVQLGSTASYITPRTTVLIAGEVMRRMVSHLILDARDPQLGRAIQRFRDQGVNLNINLLGEAVLGAREANRRLEGVHRLILRDDVDYCSIKISSIVDHMSLWGADITIEKILENLKPLYFDAARQAKPTFINMDMEEYKDLELTLEVFERLLSMPELKDLYAGIVLQAYLPDAAAAMERVQAFAARRVAEGGAPIKVRLVKGANLPMEQVEASVHGLELATFHTKEESDAQYKRVLRWALTEERLKNVHLGIAGHNLFDIAYAHLLMKERGLEGSDAVEFEMLAGMAPGQQQVVRETVGSMRLYVPVVHPKEFDVAVSYLVRRLEENASSDNFMSAVFELDSSEALFQREQKRFEAALRRSFEEEAPVRHRMGDRAAEKPADGSRIPLGSAAIPSTPGKFLNTPDTDMTTAANQEWARQLLPRIADSTLGVAEAEAARVDSEKEVHDIISGALRAQEAWAARPMSERANLLRECARVLAEHRAELLEVAASETGKTFEQGDPEVSEAIDFALYYADNAEDLASRDDIVFEARPLTLVTPPWNFPIAIPCGSIVSALVTGSAVVVKPAPQAMRTGAYLVRLLHEAGIPEDVLRLVDVPENEIGQALIGDERIDQIILTGAYETAKLFARFNPLAKIKAETSGKNAIIVTPHADLDLAAYDVAHSAFGHAGQKCSAASLVITVGSVERSRRFQSQLADAVLSLQVGWPTDPTVEMGPVIEKPGEKLQRGLTVLGEGEKWLAKPEQLDETGRLFSPGVRTGVKKGSEFHRTEYFGPILGVMHADTLDEAIEIQNGTDYGLTAGLHSLEPAEIAEWASRVEAGNLYINRGITGAIVERQSFGGWKRSAIGPTAKAGGPNYLMHLMVGSDPVEGERDAAWLEKAKKSDIENWSTFYAPKDVQQLHGEINVMKYRPVEMLIRVGGKVTEFEVERVLHAAKTVGATVSVSVPEQFASQVPTDHPGVEVVTESAAALAARLRTAPIYRVRAIGGVEPEIREAINLRPEVALFDHAVVQSGRAELISYVHEQAVSATNHRYGNPLPYDLEKIIREV